jgi:hypothetical protein
VVFKDVPILYSPYLDFSLSGRRKSGLLPPTIGSTGQSGFEYTQPFYWNIAPNRDATIAPRLLARRGVLMNGEFRYLESDLGGELRGEWLPDDRVKNETRYGYSWQHRQNFGQGFSGTLNMQAVSDDAYFTDLSDKISATSLTNLPREASLFFDGGWWNVNTRVQSFQTLQDPLAPVIPPYARVPQITLNANRQTELHMDFGLQGEFVEFDHPSLLNGQRQICTVGQRSPADLVFLPDAQGRLPRDPVFLRGPEPAGRNPPDADLQHRQCDDLRARNHLGRAQVPANPRAASLLREYSVQVAGQSAELRYCGGRFQSGADLHREPVYRWRSDQRRRPVDGSGDQSLRQAG